MPAKKATYCTVCIATLLLLVLCSGCTDQSAEGADMTQGDGCRMVVDSRGVAVQVPEKIERVVTVSDGLIEGVMTVLGEQEKIVGVGSSCIQRNFNYTFQTFGGETYEYKDGMNPVTYLNPGIMDLPLVGASSAAINYETLAGLEPDIVILRVGSCTLRSMGDEGVQKTIQTIESLGIPVVVLKAHPCYDEPDLSTVSDEIRIIGEVFGKAERAGELADYLESQTQLVFERTKDIPEEDKPSVLVFGASPRSRKDGGAGNVKGTDTIESYFIEEIAHAKNAYKEPGNSVLVSAEQLLALDPDVIILGTSSGYHPPEELYSAPYYQNVAELSAVKNRNISSFPWEPCNCAKRLEYPIDVMVIAKAAYPDRFSDIALDEWLLDFYVNVYGVDEATASQLRSAQWMDWCVYTCPTCG
ncbi:MAG: ABC transporter substrate-binding protein [Methanosarcinaceae archaeon]|nr:ABC transporter substrate-binding protein [Methanosarcinaceae archaeon]